MKDDSTDGIGHRCILKESLRRLGAGRILILAPGTTNIWAANPFCAVPSNFRVSALGRTYWGICIWDALGIPAALHTDASITARCSDSCEQEIVLDVRDGVLVRSEGIVHFGGPAPALWAVAILLGAQTTLLLTPFSNNVTMLARLTGLHPLEVGPKRNWRFGLFVALAAAAYLGLLTLLLL